MDRKQKLRAFDKKRLRKPMQGNIKDFLPLVRKPSRYIGNEVNSIKKDLSKVRLTFALAFPDAYEVGMSHLGLQILYQILNSREDIACERVYAPWTDMEALLRDKGMRLSTLESSIPLSDLDILGFSLQYELSYTNILQMLELGGVPFLSKDRKEGDPFVAGGGPSAFNPEPVAEFFDFILLGDGEEAVLEIADAVIEGKEKGWKRIEVLERLSSIPGVYVPSFFEPFYNDDGTIREITPLRPGYNKITKRTVPDINSLPLPIRPVIPYMETIHDRVSVEIARGCTRGCRFCQAGSIYRPVRERTPANILKIVETALKNTGYDEVSLLSLSTGDYTLIEELITGLMSRVEKDRVAVSLPSLRVGTLSARLANEIKKVRKTGFTLAPEAGSERLRRLINKGIKEEDLHAAAFDVFSLGWKLMKLYFMIGLPTETDEDIVEIARLAECVRAIGKRASGKSPQINVSVSSFIPKPYTPFQWEPQISQDECARRQGLLRGKLGSLNLGFKWHDPKMSILEGVFARGDRRLSKVILNAFKKGCRFDGWSEKFSFDAWKAAFADESVDMSFYIARTRPHDEVFPWDHLNPGVTKEFLLKEFKAAIDLARTPDCRVDRCSNCGVCDHKTIKNVTIDDDGTLEKVSHGNAPEPEPLRLRLRFSKTGELKYLSHLELVNTMVRAIKRAGLPLKFSQGFHPLPKISFSSTLPVGIESLDEYMDIELLKDGKVSAEEAASRLNSVLPDGLKILGAEAFSLKVSLPSAILTEYFMDLKDCPLGLNIDLERIEGIVRDFLNKDSLKIRVDKGEEKAAKEIDIRAAVESLSVHGESTLKLVLKKAEGSTARPHDILATLLDIPRQDASLIPVVKTSASFDRIRA
ncbi:MAG: TIGR03960 family B12-binding radical SAM protein [Deltaproteobacteria bacterium]|nr:TIGR03960 family B12-binding radical SAM protein [Deltaproteobacteria bacterium]